MGLLDGKLARLALAGLKPAGLTKPATLHVTSPGTRAIGSLTSGTSPTYTAQPARGLVTQWRRERLGATLVQASDRVILLLGATLAGIEPKVGDAVTIEGVTTRVLDVDRDPAGATFTMLTRGEVILPPPSALPADFPVGL